MGLRAGGRSLLALVILVCGMAPVSASRVQAPPPAAAPPVPAGTGFLLGQVVDPSGDAIANAIVTLSGMALVPSKPGGSAPAPGAATPVVPVDIPPRRMLTNASGRFLFSALPKGTYRIETAKSGYVSSGAGKQRPDGQSQSIELDDGERNGSIRITMWKFAAISGVLTDDAGEPFVGATIWSLRRSFSTGRSQMVDGPSATTDDRGYFRVGGLTPGEYVVCVVASQTTLPAALAESINQSMAGGQLDLRSLSMSNIGLNVTSNAGGIRMGDYVVQTVGPYSRGMVPPGPDESGRMLSFQTTFYPGAVDLARAEVITLSSGEERTGANINLKPVPLARVSGTVVGPNGPVANVGVRMSPGYSPDLGNELSFESALTISDANGRFMFMGVPAGPYILRALRIPAPVSIPPGSTVPQDSTLWANVPVTIGSDGSPDLTVKLSPGFRISGRVQFDGAIPKPNVSLLQTLIVTIQPADGHQVGYVAALRARVEADGTFTTYEIPPGKYVVRAGSLQSWTYKVTLAGGRDVGSVPLDLQSDLTNVQIVMTDRATELAGSVRDDAGKIDPKSAVIIMPAERDQWSGVGETPRRLRILRVSQTGTYRTLGLPPGQYLMVAIPDAAAAVWQNPTVLERLSRMAVQVPLGDGEKKNQNLVVRPFR